MPADQVQGNRESIKHLLTDVIVRPLYGIRGICIKGVDERK